MTLVIKKEKSSHNSVYPPLILYLSFHGEATDNFINYIFFY